MKDFALSSQIEMERDPAAHRHLLLPMYFIDFKGFVPGKCFLDSEPHIVHASRAACCSFVSIWWDVMGVEGKRAGQITIFGPGSDRSVVLVLVCACNHAAT